MAPDDSSDYARRLYWALREADALQLHTVFAVPPAGDDGLAYAIRDRLARAAAAAQEAAEATGLNLGATQRAYEMAGAAKDYPALTAQLAATVETVARYRATQALLAEPTGPVARLGARIAPDTTPLATAAAAIDAGDLAAADGFLQAIADEREQQTAYGWYAVSGTGALVALGAALLFWRNQRRRRWHRRLGQRQRSLRRCCWPGHHRQRSVAGFSHSLGVSHERPSNGKQVARGTVN